MQDIFKLSYGTVVNQIVTPVYSDEYEKEYFESDDLKGKRVKLDTTFTFSGEDYDSIIAQPYNTTFYLQIDKGFQTNYFKGYFKVHEEDVNQDNNFLKVKLTTSDDYYTISEMYSTEIVMSELDIAKTKFSYKRFPLVQIYITDQIMGDSYVTNYIGGTYWRQQCSSIRSEQMSTNNDWENSSGTPRSFCYLDGAIPISGKWTATNITTTGVVGAYLKDDGKYYMYRENLYTTWKIKNTNTNTIEWESDYLTGGDRYDITAHTFEMTTSPFLEAKFNDEKWVYFRVLCDDEMFADYPSIEVYDNPQVFCDNQAYTKIIKFGSLTDEIEIKTSTETQFTPNILNIAPDGRYFSILDSLTQYKSEPLSQGYWGYFSIWAEDNASAQTKQNIYSTDIYSYGYSLENMINAILDKYSITKRFKSELLNTGTLNPIHGTINRSPIFTDVTNVTGLDPRTNKLATKDTISLSQLFRFFSGFNIYWDLTNTHFRIEHEYFYDNGESYTLTPQVEIDLTDKQNTRNSRNWAYGVDSWVYNEIEEFKFYEWNVADCSDFFETSKMKAEVNNEQSYQQNYSSFHMDINYINAMSGVISQVGDGWLFCMVKDGSIETFTATTLKDTIITSQNILASLPYLTRVYQGYNLSVDTVTIDGLTQNTKGFFRPRIQQITYPLQPNDSDPNPLKLIRTNIGDGYIRNLVVNQPYNYCKIELAHAVD